MADAFLKRPGIAVGLGLLWVVAVGVGFWGLWSYSSTPGPEARMASTWPDGAIPANPGRARLVMVVHPECACSRASVHELSRVLARAGRPVDATVIVDIPPGLTVGADNALVRGAEAIPGVRVVHDRGGRIARRFGARVSGHTLLYDTSGALAFAGGITRGRGHQGDNPSQDALMAAIASGTPAAQPVRTFGCLLAREDQNE